MDSVMRTERAQAAVVAYKVDKKNSGKRNVLICDMEGAACSFAKQVDWDNSLDLRTRGALEP